MNPGLGAVPPALQRRGTQGPGLHEGPGPSFCPRGTGTGQLCQVMKYELRKCKLCLLKSKLREHKPDPSHDPEELGSRLCWWHICPRQVAATREGSLGRVLLLSPRSRGKLGARLAPIHDELASRPSHLCSESQSCFPLHLPQRGQERFNWRASRRAA